MANDKSNRGKPIVKLVVALIVVVLSLLGVDVFDIIPPQETGPTTSQEETIKTEIKEGEMIITMIECGQADSFLIQQGDMNALVDCGKVSTGDDVVAYLKSIGVERLDYVFGTHQHEDHMGGMQEVITNFEVGKIIMQNKPVTPAWYTKLMTEIKNGGYVLEYPEVGDTYKVGDAVIEILGPLDLDSSNPNNWSIVMMVSFGEQDVLMTGDAETSVERALVKAGTDLDAEILKVGHHCSDTSSSDEFLDAVNPDYAMFSCSVGNNHNHPVEETIHKYEDRNIPVYRTDECGTVVVTITSDSIEFSTEPGDYLSGIELAEREGK